MSKIQVFTIFIDLFQFHISSRIESNVVEYHHQLSEKIIYLHRGLQLSSDKYLYGPIIFQNIVELIKHGLVIFLCEFFTSLLLIFNGDGFLSLLSRQFLGFFPFFHFELVFDDVPFVVHLYSFLFVLYFIRLLLVSLLEFLN